jgi:hypothetical protein
MTSTIGIPIKLLNEAQGHIVTLEITSGQTYRGKLIEGLSLFPSVSRSPPSKSTQSENTSTNSCVKKQPKTT